MFKIGDFSKFTQVSVRMLRYYDETGLLKPAKIDNFTGYRYFTAKQINELNIIVSLRDIGFNVSEIINFLDTVDIDEKKNLLERKYTQIEDNICESNQKLKKINFALKNLLKETEVMNYNVEIKKVPSYKVISLREVIKAYDSEGILWGKIGEYIGKNQIAAAGICFAIYQDECYKESDVDVEVLMEVKKLGKSKDGYIYKETQPLDKVASILVTGDYSNISPAFEYIGEWVEENGHEICGNLRQVTIKGPWCETDVDNYLTEIQVPLK